MKKERKPMHEKDTSGLTTPPETIPSMNTSLLDENAPAPKPHRRFKLKNLALALLALTGMTGVAIAGYNMGVRDEAQNHIGDAAKDVAFMESINYWTQRAVAAERKSEKLQTALELAERKIPLENVDVTIGDTKLEISAQTHPSGNFQVNFNADGKEIAWLSNYKMKDNELIQAASGNSNSYVPLFEVPYSNLGKPHWGGSAYAFRLDFTDGTSVSLCIGAVGLNEMHKLVVNSVEEGILKMPKHLKEALGANPTSARGAIRGNGGNDSKSQITLPEGMAPTRTSSNVKFPRFPG